MKVLMVSTNRHCFPVPVMPMGACVVAEAAEKAGHNVKMLDLMFEKEPVRALDAEIERIRPDVIGLSVRNIDNNDMRNPLFFIEELRPLMECVRKRTDVPVVLGGAAAGVMPEEIMRHAGINLAVSADGETVFPQLLDRLAEGCSADTVPGVAFIEDDNYASVPRPPTHSGRFCAPDFGKWIDVGRYSACMSTVPVQTKLGCRFKCVYCTYRKIEGPTYRLFNAEEVAETTERLVLSGLRDIEFVDNVFNAPYEHALSVCETIVNTKRRPYLHSIELNPLFIDDTLISLMERAGFTAIGITVESASDAVLSGLKKGFDASHVYGAAEVARRHKLPCLWIFMLGGPGESESTVKETLRFAEKSVRRGDAAFFNIGLRIYPGTELEEIARRQGILSVDRREMLAPIFYCSPEVNTEWILRQVGQSMERNMNFINGASIGVSYLPALHRIGHMLGVRPPLWRFTRTIRRGLRFCGVDA